MTAAAPTETPAIPMTVEDASAMMEAANEWLKTSGIEFATNVVVALLVFFIGRMLIGWIVSGARKAMQRADVDKTLETFLCNLLRMVLLVLVVITAIGMLGVQTTSFIAVFGAAGLAIGLALQGSLSNFAAGVLIVLFRPYRVGDWIEGAGVSGSVEQVQILTTVLKTGDNKKIIIPNSQIMDSVITNYSANDTRRVDMVVGVSYSDDLDKVKKILEEIVAGDERVLAEPAVTIAVSELADSSVNFVLRPWVKTADYWGVKFDMTETVKKRFDQEGISIPFPQQDVYVHNVRDD